MKKSNVKLSTCTAVQNNTDYKAQKADRSQFAIQNVYFKYEYENGPLNILYACAKIQ